jgi:putative transposase
VSLQDAIPGATVVAICRAFGFSRAAYYAAGEAPSREPRPKQPTPAGLPSVEELTARIRGIVAENPAWGTLKVWATLKHREKLLVGKHRVRALMRSLGLLFPARRENAPLGRGHVTVPEPNRRWATDFTCVRTKDDGLVYVFPVIDSGCRSCLDLEVSTVPDVGAALRPLERALEAAFGGPDGVPHDFELRTDNGSVYTSRIFSNVERVWRIDHTFAPVGRPTGNSAAERVIKTLKEECLWLRDWTSAAEVRDALAAWRVSYNERRPHQAIGWETPAERRRRKLPKEPQPAAA